MQLHIYQGPVNILKRGDQNNKGMNMEIAAYKSVTTRK